MAQTAWLFGQRAQPKTRYLAIPKVFSGRREYTTCDWYTPDIIAGDKVYTCDDPDGFNFAIIESAMFMTWQKAIGGRLKSDPSFSNTVVWNTLPLPQSDGTTRTKIVDAGQQVLKVRQNHRGQSLADLYDPDYMPVDLRKAHRELDKVVDVAFGASGPCKDDNERLRVLFDSYARMTGNAD
nr:type IIL restriction-modification enzyme MmeI [uncultured Bifidobacterium sp.]